MTVQKRAYFSRERVRRMIGFEVKILQPDKSIPALKIQMTVLTKDRRRQLFLMLWHASEQVMKQHQLFQISADPYSNRSF